MPGEAAERQDAEQLAAPASADAASEASSADLPGAAPQDGPPVVPPAYAIVVGRVPHRPAVSRQAREAVYGFRVDAPPAAVLVPAAPHDLVRAAQIRRSAHSQEKAAVDPRESAPDAVALLPFPARVWLVERQWFGRRSAAAPRAAF